MYSEQVKRIVEKIDNRSYMTEPSDKRTEKEIMIDKGYMRIYGCGTLAFILN